MSGGPEPVRVEIVLSWPKENTRMLEAKGMGGRLARPVTARRQVSVRSALREDGAWERADIAIARDAVIEVLEKAFGIRERAPLPDGTRIRR